MLVGPCNLLLPRPPELLLASSPRNLRAEEPPCTKRFKIPNQIARAALLIQRADGRRKPNFPFTIILQSVEIFTSEERLPIYMRMTKVGGGTENHLVLNKPRAKKACIKQCIVCNFVSFSLQMHTRAFFAIAQVTLIAKILAYTYLFSDRMYGSECCDRLLLQILCGFHSLTRPTSAFQINSQKSCHSFKQHLNFKPGKSIFNMPIMQEILLSRDHILVLLKYYRREMIRPIKSDLKLRTLTHSYMPEFYSVDTTGNKHSIISTDLFIKQNIVIWENKKRVWAQI